MKTIQVSLTKAECDHLLRLLMWNTEDGGYCGNKKQYDERAARIARKLCKVDNDAH